MNPKEMNAATETNETNVSEPTSRKRYEGQAPKKRKYTTSAKVFAANRRNALRSTGPRTVAGKESSRLNSMRHGIDDVRSRVHRPTGCDQGTAWSRLPRGHGLWRVVRLRSVGLGFETTRGRLTAASRFGFVNGGGGTREWEEVSLRSRGGLVGIRPSSPRLRPTGIREGQEKNRFCETNSLG